MAVVEAVLVDRLGASNEPLSCRDGAAQGRWIARALGLAWGTSLGRWPS